LRPGSKSQDYRVQTFVFVPRVLDLTKRSYPKESFYADTANFLRITTPRRKLSELSDKSVVRPWAEDVKREIAEFREGKSKECMVAERSLKLLGCVFKGALRDSRNALFEDMHRAFARADIEGIESMVSGFLEDLNGAWRRLQKIGRKGEGEDLPPRLAKAWKAVDEYTSLLAEEALTDVLLRIEAQAPNVALKDLINRLKAEAIAQFHHRRDRGFKTYAMEVGDNEYLSHRWRVLKRFVSSALYVNVDREDTGLMVSDMIGGLAAALAMLVATVSILFINERWPANLSWAFVTAMVASYVVKDRLKEWGKRSLGKRLASGFADHVLKIRSPGTKNILGICKESFTIKKVKDLPAEVVALRFSDLGSHEAIEGRPETVMWHTKEISLSSEGLRSEFAGASGITDVFRLNVSPMLSRMDDPWESYNFVHPETGELRSTRCARVYHVNIVLCMSTGEEDMTLTRVRVVLNKKGILRVESVKAPTFVQSRPVPKGDEIAKVRMGDDDA
jgi:hypothetical protein